MRWRESPSQRVHGSIYCMCVCVHVCTGAGTGKDKSPSEARHVSSQLVSCLQSNDLPITFLSPRVQQTSAIAKPVHPFSFSLARMAHLDQGQIIIQNGLRFFQTRPKIHAFLSLLTDSWHEKRARILPGIAGSQREKMVRTGGTVGIR